MTIREQMEEREKEYLSPCATLSMASRGEREMSHSVTSDRFFRGTEIGSCTVRHSGA